MEKLLLVNHVAKFRKCLGYSQFDLAYFCHCSKNTISSIERYECFPTLKLALLICSALHCNINDVFELVCYD